VLANALLAHFVFETSGVYPIDTLLLAAASVTAVTLLTGLLSNRGVTDHPPLEVLRQES
jgi:putative ABC transport system permease protein